VEHALIFPNVFNVILDHVLLEISHIYKGMHTYNVLTKYYK
jgi:hypothetical protein